VELHRSREAYDNNGMDSSDDENVLKCKELLKEFLCRLVQGSSRPLVELQEYASKKINQSWISKREQSSDLLCNSTELSVGTSTSKLFDPVYLGEEIKLVAERKAYGERVDKSGTTYSDTEELALWRWEVFQITNLSPICQSIVKDVRMMRARYGRAIKANAKLSHYLLTAKQDSTDYKTELDRYEEIASKAMVEVEKAKMKREEIERKKTHDKLDKERKQELKEARLRARDEEAKRKREEVRLEREHKAKEEKEKAALQGKALQKERKFMESFLVIKPGPGTFATRGSQRESGGLGALVKITETAGGSGTSPQAVTDLVSPTLTAGEPESNELFERMDQAAAAARGPFIAMEQYSEKDCVGEQKKSGESFLCGLSSQASSTEGLRALLKRR